MANLQFFEYNMLRRSNERKYSMENLEALVLRLIDLPTETMWVEFKHNNFDSEMIGKDICALANSATYSDKACSYMVWGIDDTTHKIIGTDKSQYNIKKGGQELESWLRKIGRAHV